MKPKQLLVEYWKETGIIKDEVLIKAFLEIPREMFIPEDLVEEAYGDYPLPIGHSQTISQPTTIMIMTQALELKKGDKVLEVGAGSGYQAALIAKIVETSSVDKGKVITTEIIPELARFAEQNITKLGIKNITVVCCDGSQGYSAEAPYDKIIVTAACPRIPQPLIDQLKEGGIMVLPVGSFFFGQKMIKAKKLKTGELVTESLGDFLFVPLKGKYGY